MNIASIMSTPVIGIAPTATIADAIRIMLDKHVSGLPVVSTGGELVGMLSEGDLLRRQEIGTAKRRPRWIELFMSGGKLSDEYVHTHGRRVSEIMTTSVITANSTTDLEDCVDLMFNNRVKRLPVLEDGRLVGIVSRADLLRALASKLPSPSREFSDSRIRADIVAELDAQTWIDSAAIQVDVKNGAVMLTGTIFDERNRQALVVAAENVPGVKSVSENLLFVEPISGTPIPLPAQELRRGGI